MLSPVRASLSSEFVLASQLVQDGGEKGQRAVKAEVALAILSDISNNQAGLKLAGLLGNAGLSSGDVLTNLALNFAKALNQQPLPNESLKAFVARVAETILALPALERVAAESKSGLLNLGISASSLATALKNPASSDAARLVALIETKLESPRESALKTAISSYQALAGREQGARNNSVPTGTPSAPAEAPQSAPRNPSPNGRGVEVLRLLQGGASSGETVVANAPAQAARVSVQGNNAAGQAIPEAVKAKPATVNATPPQTGTVRGEAVEVRQPGQDGKAAGFVAREASLAPKSASAVNPQVSTPSSGQSAAHLATLTAAPPATSARSAHVIDFVREAMARAENQDAVTAAAHKVAAAVTERQVQLFSGAAPSEEAEGDLEKQISRALGNAARASQAAAAGLAAADQALQQQAAAQPHIGIPFAQVPYPQTPAEEAKKKAKDDRRDGDDREGEEEAGDGSEEQSMQGEGDAPKKREAQQEPVNDNPFAAEEPLERHASDADRAYHMYQKFGGF